MKYKPGVGAVMAWGGGLMNYSSQLNKRSWLMFHVTLRLNVNIFIRDHSHIT